MHMAHTNPMEIMDNVHIRRQVNPRTGNVTLLRTCENSGWEVDAASRRVVTAIWLLQGYPDAVNKPPVLVQGDIQQGMPIASVRNSRASLKAINRDTCLRKVLRVKKLVSLPLTPLKRNMNLF